jgi:hypothetical protein
VLERRLKGKDRRPDVAGGRVGETLTAEREDWGGVIVEFGGGLGSLLGLIVVRLVRLGLSGGCCCPWDEGTASPDFDRRRGLLRAEIPRVRSSRGTRMDSEVVRCSHIVRTAGSGTSGSILRRAGFSDV